MTEKQNIRWAAKVGPDAWEGNRRFPRKSDTSETIEPKRVNNTNLDQSVVFEANTELNIAAPQAVWGGKIRAEATSLPSSLSRNDSGQEVSAGLLDGKQTDKDGNLLSLERIDYLRGNNNLPVTGVIVHLPSVSK